VLRRLRRRLRARRLVTLRLDTPQRLCFTAAASLWCLSALAWALQISGVVVPAAPAQAWAQVAHAQAFGLGPMPLFIAGFLFTAGPRWLGSTPPSVHALVAPVALVVAGWLWAIAGTMLAPRHIAAGLWVASLGWAALLRPLWHLRAGAAGGRTLHFDLAALGCVALSACLLATAIATSAGHPDTARAAALAGLWWGVVTVFVVATHRMLPFVGGGLSARLERRWPLANLWLMWSAALVGGAATWPWAEPGSVPGALRGLHALGVALLSASWWLHGMRQPAHRAPLVAMFLRAWAWWTVAWCCVAARQWPGFDAGTQAALGTAGLHALTLGHLGGTMLAMVTRISATLAGQSLAIDRGARVLESVLQAAVLARVLATLWPPASRHGLWLAAALWAALAAAWTWRHAPGLLGGGKSPRD
jgi:uncharacterized protein involved in response to NO